MKNWFFVKKPRFRPPLATWGAATVESATLRVKAAMRSASRDFVSG
jgi:hypothetical protein